MFDHSFCPAGSFLLRRPIVPADFLVLKNTSELKTFRWNRTVCRIAFLDDLHHLMQKRKKPESLQNDISTSYFGQAGVSTSSVPMLVLKSLLF